MYMTRTNIEIDDATMEGRGWDGDLDSMRGHVLWP